MRTFSKFSEWDEIYEIIRVREVWEDGSDEIWYEFETLKRPYFFGLLGRKKWSFACQTQSIRTGLFVIEKLKL